MTAVSPFSALLGKMKKILESVDEQTGYDNSEHHIAFDHCAWQITAATLRQPWYPHAPVYQIGDDLLAIRSLLPDEPPLACRGWYVWLRKPPEGGWNVVGCICHTNPV